MAKVQLRLDEDTSFTATLFTRANDIVKVEKETPSGPWVGFYAWQRLMQNSETLRRLMCNSEKRGRSRNLMLTPFLD
jgi:hypothetical protein